VAEQDALIVEAMIEIPTGSQNKYEFDKARGLMRLDRVLFSPVYYPADYGFVPETLEEDGDPLDVMVLVTNPTLPGCLIDTRVVGALEMIDNGSPDVKLLGVPIKDPRFSHVMHLNDVPPHVRREIEYFFQTYKDLEGKKAIVNGWREVEYAAERVALARRAYADQPAKAR